MIKTVLVFGTFDVLHPGHLYFLKQAKKKGDKLIASVARDAFVKNIKKRAPSYSEQERIAHLLGSGLVDEAHLSDISPGTYRIISRIKPQLICLGYDQLQLKENLGAWLRMHELDIPIEMIHSFEPDKYKSSKLKQELYVAIDIKTTGLLPEEDKLIELGAVLFNREQELETFQAFIDPETYLSPTTAPGFTQSSPHRAEPLTGLKPPAGVLPAFVQFCRDAYPVTHQAYFTFSFLLYNLSHLAIDTPALAHQGFDIGLLYKKKYPERRDYSFNSLANLLPNHVQPETNLLQPALSQAALSDARICKELFCQYLFDNKNPELLYALYKNDWVATTDGLALSLNWQDILRQNRLSLLEAGLRQKKRVPIEYLQGDRLISYLIQPLGLTVNQEKLAIVASHQVQEEWKLAYFYLNRLKMQ